jgi:hypothetical protein
MSTAKAKSTKAVPEGVARLYRPGVLDRGLKIFAREQDEAAAKKDAPTPEATDRRADRFEAAHRAIEEDIYDLIRMLRAADYLQSSAVMDGDEVLASSARLLVEQAARMAEDLSEKYQRGFPGEGIDSRIDEDRPTAKAFILRELDACERRLRETRTQAEAISVEAVR